MIKTVTYRYRCNRCHRFNGPLYFVANISSAKPPKINLLSISGLGKRLRTVLIPKTYCIRFDNELQSHRNPPITELSTDTLRDNPRRGLKRKWRR